MNAAPASRSRRLLRVSLVVSAVCALLAMAACDEFKDRRKVQEAAKLYDDGDYERAAELYEEALKGSPHLDIAEHNAGLTYRQLFMCMQADPEIKEADLKKVANKATDHFLKYLEKNPEDADIIALMTKLWLDSGQYKQALAFWEERRAKKPKNMEVLQVLSSIYRQAGDWEKSVEYYHLQADLQDKDDAKANVLLDIAKIVYHKLTDFKTIRGMERLYVADVGIAAMQRAEGLQLSLKLELDVQSYMSSIYKFRSVAHAASWARAADEASVQWHRSKWAPLHEKWKKQEAEKRKKEEEADEEGDEESEG